MTSRLLRAVGETSIVASLPFLLLALLTFLLPLAIWPAAQDSFVTPKWSLLVICVAGMLALSLAATSWDRPLRVPLHPINALLLGFVLWNVLTVIWSKAPALSWDRLCVLGVLVLGAFAAQSLLMHQRGRLVILASVTIGASVLLSIWALVADARLAWFPESMGVRRVLFDWRDGVSTAGLGNSGHVADFIVMGFVLALAGLVVARSRRQVGLLVGALWVQAAALIVAWSVHSNLSLIVAVVFLAVLLRPALNRVVARRLARRAGVAAVGWAVIVAFFVVDHPMNPHGSRVWAEDDARGGIFQQAFASGRWKQGGSTRLAIWLTTLEIVRENPWLGTGTGTFTWVAPAARSELLLSSPELAPYSGLWTNAAHNDLLQVWSETGMPGMMLLIGLVGAVFYEANRRRRAGGLGNNLVLSTGMALLLAWIVQSQLSFPFVMPAASWMLMLLLVVPIVVPPRGREQDLLMPVQRDYGPLRLGIMLKNMQVPTELHKSVVFRHPARLGLLAAMLAVWAGVAFLAARPVVSSVLYRPVYEGLRRPGMMEMPGTADTIVHQAERALAWNPANTDCRSALTDLLVRQQRWSEALPHLEQTLRRLNASEVHLRMGATLDGLGREEEALVHWAEFLRRHPEAAGDLAPQARRVALREDQIGRPLPPFALR